MKLTIVAGSDDVLVNQAREGYTAQWTGAVERFDLSEGGENLLADLLASPSLFGGVRYGVLDHLEANEAALVILETYGHDSDAEVVACWRSSVRASAKKRLAALGELDIVTVPKGKDITARVREMASRHQVTLSAEGVSVLAERMGENWGRVEGVLRQLSDAGLTSPSSSMLERLCGSTTSRVAPWDITDAISSGRIAEAMDMAMNTEMVVLANWIAKETLNLARVSEEKWNGETAASELGIHPFRARKLVTWAGRGPRDWSRAIRAAARLDIVAKSGDTDAVLVVLGEWASSTRR